MSTNAYECWGRWPRPERQEALILDRPEIPAAARPVLPRGRGRSYGDSCLNEGGTLLDTRRLDHFLDWDEATGHLHVESGVTLAQILDTFAPRGWFLPVVPGTEQITVGGAIANDVHGKNHHRLGTFGEHVAGLRLVRSDGQVLSCTCAQNPDLFAATVGGLGLTGLMASATIVLRPITSSWILSETIPFDTLDEFLALSAASEAEWEYTVAWGDWRARPGAAGRGLFLRGNHAEGTPPGRPATPPRRTAVTVPAGTPGWMLNDATLRLFNSWQAHRTAGRTRREYLDYRAYFFPLDGVAHWNRLYGDPGFVQYQCVLPGPDPSGPFRAIFDAVTGSPTGSYLTVLKTFGDRVPVGPLSFPRHGVTIALDFPLPGPGTLALCDRLDAIVREAGGAVYPAKDARMSAASFEAYFPRAGEFARWIDPACSSSFWRRVTRAAAA